MFIDGIYCARNKKTLSMSCGESRAVLFYRS